MSDRTATATWHEALFAQPLLDLGPHESKRFAGVLSPRGEVGAKRDGVNAVFLDNAEEYYKKYQGFDYWRGLIADTTRRIGVTDPRTIIEYGCGFGNATLPMLDLFPAARVVATDISPNLLSILRRLLDGRGLGDRCVPIAMDAQKPYIRPGTADLVFGAAVLHHLAEPGPFIRGAMEVLRPGGYAFFYEPLEGGNTILVLICEEIRREAARRRYSGHVTAVLGNFAKDLKPQIFRQALPGWRDRDDKWAFPRCVLDEIASDAGAEVRIYGLHDNVGQFRRHLTYMLKVYAGIPEDTVPGWAWEIVDRFDREVFSPEMLRDLALEGCIIFRKLASA
jgi:SAM-dependent methyltransferase